MKSLIGGVALIGAMLGLNAAPASAGQDVRPTAVLTFAERGTGVVGYGPKVTDLLTGLLADCSDIVLVDRVVLGEAAKELKLGASGLVKEDQASRLGQWTGAKLLVVGSVVEVDKNVYLIAKVIGTETSRVKGATVKGRINDELGPLVERLADELKRLVAEKGKDLVAAEPTPADRVAAIKAAIGTRKPRSLAIRVAERHLTDPGLDPAARPELMRLARAVGFEVYTGDESEKKAEILLDGSAFSEAAGRHDDLIAVKGRLEVRAVERSSGKVLVADKQIEVVVDIAEQVAGKTALERAAGAVAERVLPTLVGD